MRHGGDPAAGAALYGVSHGDWLDLSTGINPRAWPWRAHVRPEAIDLERLPAAAETNALIAAARRAYRVDAQAQILPVAGSETAIRQLPALVDRVALLDSSYSSYSAAYSASLRHVAALCEVEAHEGLVIVNPNNPDGRLLSQAAIAGFAAERPDRTVIVDEAYCDALPPRASVLSLAGQAPNLLVLRSFGKFYGLPGLRLGFVIGGAGPVRELRRRLGDWPVSQAAIAIGTAALADGAWRQETRGWLAGQAGALRAILKRQGIALRGNCPLFTLVRHPGAAVLHRRLAQKGVWTRRFEERPDRLRIGLPPDAAGLARFEAALAYALAGIGK